MKELGRSRGSDVVAAGVIRAARKRAKLSQEALADLAGLHRTSISLLERGLRSPTLATLDAIARAMSMPPSTLMGLIADAASQAAGASACSSGEEPAVKELSDANSAVRD